MHRTSNARGTDGTRLHQIGEVADLIGLSLRTIRHYEEVGVVVPSERTSGGFRLYTDRDVDRLRKVMGMKPIGFSLEEIREVLELLDAAEADDVSPSVLDRLQMYAALAVERRNKYRVRLALGETFTEMLADAAGVSQDREGMDGSSTP